MITRRPSESKRGWRVDTSDYAARFARFDASISAMHHTVPYDVKLWYAYPSLSDQEITALEARVVERQGVSGFHVAPSMRPFFRIVGGWDLSWVYDDPSPVSGQLPYGKCTLSSLPGIYMAGDGSDDDEGRGDVPYDEDYRLFDWIGFQEEVVLRFQRGVDEPMLYLHDVPSDLYHPLALDFTAYTDLLLQCRALSPWQRFFVTTPGYHVDDETTRVFFDNLAYLFPDADPAHFRR